MTETSKDWPGDDQPGGASLPVPDTGYTEVGARVGRYDLLLGYRLDRLSRSVRGLDELSPRRCGVQKRNRTVRYGRAGRPAG